MLSAVDMGRVFGPGDVRHRMAALVRRDGDWRWLSDAGSVSAERREKGEARLCGRAEEKNMI